MNNTRPSFYLISSAVDGNVNAIEKILALYDPYISKCCLRPFYDKYGNVCIVVDMGDAIRELYTTEDRKRSIHFLLHLPSDRFCRSGESMFSIHARQIFTSRLIKRQWKQMKPESIFSSLSIVILFRKITLSRESNLLSTTNPALNWRWRKI